MKTNTSIVPAQQAVSQIVPKPTKTDIIDALVRETIAAREAENAIREGKRAILQAKLNKEIEKFKKKTIKIGDLSVRWENAGAQVYIQGKCIDGSSEMVRLHRLIKEIPDLTTHPDLVKTEVQKRMKDEMLNSIMAQPGVKEALQSTIAKLGL
jgi:hypothetical protein